MVRSHTKQILWYVIINTQHTARIRKNDLNLGLNSPVRKYKNSYISYRGVGVLVKCVCVCVCVCVVK